MGGRFAGATATGTASVLLMASQVSVWRRGRACSVSVWYSSPAVSWRSGLLARFSVSVASEQA
uniref:Uncharacterized protein n=1 Tax=Arundo donax TaxID=35708 RepID=A0A0A9FYS0_ARUDO